LRSAVLSTKVRSNFSGITRRGEGLVMQAHLLRHLDLR
jgi:hypothetical protein